MQLRVRKPGTKKRKRRALRRAEQNMSGWVRSRGWWTTRSGQWFKWNGERVLAYSASDPLLDKIRRRDPESLGMESSG
jgi:hypothetical protein